MSLRLIGALQAVKWLGSNVAIRGGTVGAWGSPGTLQVAKLHGLEWLRRGTVVLGAHLELTR